MRMRERMQRVHVAGEARAGVAALVLSLSAVPALAQTPVTDIHAEVAALRAEVRALRADLEAIRASLGARSPLMLRAAHAVPPSAQGETAGAVEPSSQAADPQAIIEMLQTQVAELSQSKVGTESRLPVRLFGTIHSHVFGNSGNANWLDNPNLLNPVPADGESGTFSAALRQTRLGLVADGPTLGSFRSSANVAVDFLGGIPGFQTGQTMGLPRVLVAFARLENDRTAFMFGQDHVMLAPRDPTSLAAFAFPLLFRSGNLYLRAPQVRLEQALGSYARIEGGIVAPIAGDVPGEDYRFVPPALSGERSRRPGLQTRLSFSTGEADSPRLGEMGVSGHYGWERRETTLAKSWAAALDFGIRRDRIGAAGEIYVGDNIDAFGGALGLAARSAGGWAELQLFPSDRLSFAAGAGIDRVRNGVALPRRRNRTAFSTVIVSLTPELETSFEYRWLGMLPGDAVERRNHHLDWVFAYRF